MFIIYMVATWRFIDGDGYLTFQLEAILDILERQLWSWTCMTHCDRWGGLPHEDAIWREDVCCSIHLLKFLEDKQRFSREDCNIPKFSHDIWNIRVLNKPT